MKFHRQTSCSVMTSSFFVNVNVSFGSMQHFLGPSCGAIRFFGIEKLAVFRGLKLIIVASNSPVSLSYSTKESHTSTDGDSTNSPVSLSFSVAAIILERKALVLKHVVIMEKGKNSRREILIDFLQISRS